MDKEYFEERKASLERLIKTYQEERNFLITDYIASNRLFEDGEKVKIITLAHNGVSTDYRTMQKKKQPIILKPKDLLF